MAATLKATPASAILGAIFRFDYTGSVGGSLRFTRPDGSRYYLPTAPGSGSKTYTPTVGGLFRADLFTARRPLKILATIAFSVGSVPVTPPPPANAVRVAPENGSFVAPGGTVWYGTADKWTIRSFGVGTTVACINGTFSTPALPSGDPLPNKVKECRAVLPPMVLTGTPGPTYVDLAWTP